MTHPYLDLPSYRFWSTAVAGCQPGAIDPVIEVAEQIAPDHRVSTMGSCFAQHISRHIAEAGLCYFVPEQPDDGTDPEEARRRDFGVYSARYGNVYTTRQALQLFQRAFGSFEPVDAVWAAGDRFVDAFRPRVEPEGFASPEAVQAEAERHLSCVRRVFLESDWLILTLGLTECWSSRIDGAVYPLAPGVAAGSFDPERYAFKNMSVREVVDDLAALVEGITAVNPRIRFLLTVSPVSLVATAEDRHVLSSTVCSKSILRAAADEIERSYPHVTYFPAYEIITCPASEGRYYCDDLRQVTPLGVGHVMRVFRRHFLEPATGRRPEKALPSVRPAGENLVCDEEEIERAMADRRHE